MRMGDRPSIPGMRTVNSGSSAIAVPMPIRMASLSARSFCTSARASVPVMRHLPLAQPADHAVGGNGKLESRHRADPSSGA